MEKEQLHDDLIFVIHQFLSPEECAGLIARAEELGFAAAPVVSGNQPVYHEGIRNNERALVEDPELATRLWEQARPLLPEVWFKRKVVDLNERFRFYRYDPGQRFKAHMDGAVQRANGAISQFTFMVYLNDDFEGGCTTFFIGKPARTNGESGPGQSILHPRQNPRPRIQIVPKTGMALVFAHRLLHEGDPVIKGRKYVLRTDVMYQ